MKVIITLLLLTSSAFSAGLSLSVPVSAIRHPIKTAKSVPNDRKWMFIADAILQNANAVDYATTRYALFPGQPGYGNYCEQNALFVSSPCQINKPKFTAVKAAVLVFGVGQWVPILAGYKASWYVPTMTIVDAGLTVPLAIADGNNLYQLNK